MAVSSLILMTLLSKLNFGRGYQYIDNFETRVWRAKSCSYPHINKKVKTFLVSLHQGICVVYTRSVESKLHICVFYRVHPFSEITIKNLIFKLQCCFIEKVDTFKQNRMERFFTIEEISFEPNVNRRIFFLVE